MDKGKTILTAIGRAGLSFVLCVTVAAALLSGALGVAFDRAVYENAAVSETFVKTLYTAAQTHLEEECLFYEVPYEKLEPCLSEETVKAAARTRMVGVYDHLTDGTELPSVTIDAAPFKAALMTFFASLQPMDQPEKPEETAETIASEITKSLSYVVGMGIGDTLLNTARPAFSGTSPLRRFARAAWIFGIAAAVLIVVKLRIPDGTLKKRAYGTAGAVFIGTALVAVPTWLCIRLDLPSKLAIGASALREYVNAVLYTVLHHAGILSTVAFTVAAVLLIASVVWVVRENKENGTSV